MTADILQFPTHAVYSPTEALAAFVARYQAMSRAEQRAQDRRWYLRNDARCVAGVTDELIRIRRAVEIPQTRRGDRALMVAIGAVGDE